MTDFNLTPGSTYRVTSARNREESFVTEGTFAGVTSLGSIDALILEVDAEDSPVLIPTHVILRLEVVEAMGEDELEDDEATMHYT